MRESGVLGVAFSTNTDHLECSLGWQRKVEQRSNFPSIGVRQGATRDAFTKYEVTDNVLGNPVTSP